MTVNDIPMPKHVPESMKKKFEILYDEPMTADQRWQSISESMWKEFNLALKIERAKPKKGSK